MVKEDLDKALEQLHSELGRTENMGDATREVARVLQSDIQQALADPEHHPALLRRLEDNVAHLEAEHPALTAAVSTVVNILSNMGV
ncbi:MAG: DUF4404 family protein [Anaerolineae bacterium]